MTIEEFWKLIDDVNAAAGPNMDDKTEALRERLEALEAGEVADFQTRFDEQMARAYTWDLWAAAFIIDGGCSDDGFMDFRSSLLSMGRAFYEAALADAESLADVDVGIVGWLFYEGFAYPCSDVYSDKTGQAPPRTVAHPDQPAGEEWNEDEQVLKQRFPRLFAKYWDAPVDPWDAGQVEAPSPGGVGAAPAPGRRPWWRFW